MAPLALLAAVLVAPTAATFNLSNTLGDGMVLQRAPRRAVVWGFGDSGAKISTRVAGQTALNTTVGSDGVWRQALQPMAASAAPTDITFTDGIVTITLHGVLFGDVYMCSGQSNMQYTPLSMAGMNNLTAELAAADAYRGTIRFFTVGMETDCGQIDCSKPFSELAHGPSIRSNMSAPCRRGRSCRELWEPAGSSSLGRAAWDHFSAVCFLTARRIHDELGGEVPLGLISSNWGGTPVQSWEPNTGVLYNSMIAPFAVGPMALTGVMWYQGEANVGAAGYYAKAFPAMITGWRQAFANPALWFGFVQIAGFGYSRPSVRQQCEQSHSWAAGDLRQAQLAALALPNVGFTTAIDTGDWSNIHPPDKQNPSLRLANQALVQVYHKTVAGADFPVYAGSSVAVSQRKITVRVAIRGSLSGKPIKITSAAPLAATQSSTLGKPGSVPRNMCVTMLGYPRLPCDCGYPYIYGKFANGTTRFLNATAAIDADGTSVVLTAATLGDPFEPTASSYGRASWPMTLFFAEEGGNPVIPWYSNFSSADPWQPPEPGVAVLVPAVEEANGHVESPAVYI
ncbi:unnamed protein product [Prorocentrum cordatum]|uniref:Sialate O-acetylesterase domain-containing protein n=1 Tax=Prorocentrum cordatum TaxID=2364126 RepID=A0ABN9PMV5_9DINO|nr:unnamed protein product [Polarella glacialis]